MIYDTVYKLIVSDFMQVIISENSEYFSPMKIECVEDLDEMDIAVEVASKIRSILEDFEMPDWYDQVAQFVSDKPELFEIMRKCIHNKLNTHDNANET